MLGHAIDYLSRSPAAAAIIGAARDTGTIIGLNPYGADNYPDVSNPGGTMYDPDSDTAIWNPYSALQVMRPDNTIIGVQSAALGLLHELTHGLDPALMENLLARLPGSGYYNQAEYMAIQLEAIVARELGEPARDNWKGNDIIAFNPTTATIEDEHGGLLWAQLNENGVWEYGPLFGFQGTTPQEYVPRFGSTEPPPADPNMAPDGRWFPDDFGSPMPTAPSPDLPNEHDYDWTLQPDSSSEHDMDWTLTPMIANRPQDDCPVPRDFVDQVSDDPVILVGQPWVGPPGT